MAHPIVRDERPATVQTRVWVQEHAWLYSVFKSPSNTVPKFRFPDLLGACVALVVGCADGQRRLVEFLVTELTRRDPASERRSCDIWPAQFDQLVAARGAAWNRFPNPMYDLEHIATACVAVAMAQPDGEAAVLAQARVNLLARAKSARASAN